MIDYGKVQSKVSLKYDSWHKDALGKFGHMLGNEMSEFHSQVSKSRVDLEQQSVEAASTSEAVNFITYVQGLKRKMKGWEKQVNVYKDGQRILERQRFVFPSNWLHVDNVDGEWGAFNEIIKRKDARRTVVKTFGHFARKSPKVSGSLFGSSHFINAPDIFSPPH